RVPSATEAAAILDAIASEGRLAAAGRSLAERLSASAKRPRALVEAVLAWVIREAETVGASAPPSAAGPIVRRPLRLRAAEWALMGSAVLPAAALLP
ncbi:MAG TPA: hypothetical protein VFM57_10100, partial [Thermoleophilaceae bacterium]|nr:hypothetical protein [Thermoleophilaceae bacterium]